MSYGYPVTSPARITGVSPYVALTDGTSSLTIRSADLSSATGDVVIVLPSTQGNVGNNLSTDGSSLVWIEGPTLSSVGTGVSVINNEIGPSFVLKSLTSGTGITLVDSPDTITINNSSPGEDITFSSAGGEQPFVDGTNSGEFKGIQQSHGIDIIDSSVDLTIRNRSPADIVTLESAGGEISLVNPASVNPNFLLKSITTDPVLQLVDNGSYFSINKILGFASIVYMVGDTSDGGDWSSSGWRNVHFNAIETSNSTANTLFTLDTTSDIEGMYIQNLTGFNQDFLIDTWITKPHSLARMALRVATGDQLLSSGNEVTSDAWGIQGCTEIGTYAQGITTNEATRVISEIAYNIPAFTFYVPRDLFGYTNSIQLRQSAVISVPANSTVKVRANVKVQTTGNKFTIAEGSASWYTSDVQTTGGFNLLGNPVSPCIYAWMRALQIS